MAISVDPITHIISVPKADLTLVQVSPTEIRELSLDDFRSWLNNWEDDDEGIVQLKTHDHNTEVSLGGLTYARVIEILDPYSITFEDGQYAVNLVGANSNVGDKINVNQVSVRSSNSAGLISSPDIEYASFQSGVWLDAVNGSDDNKGNEQWPIKTPERALVVASYRGFRKIYLLSDAIFTTGHNLNDFSIVGQSHVHTDLIIETGADCERVHISKCVVSGVIDGDTEIDDCVIGDVSYFNGHIHDCGLIGTITLAGTKKALISGCKTIDQDSSPVIDMGGSGQSLSMPNYSGIITVSNLSDATQEIGIGINAGMLTLDSTITAGTIILAGVGILIDNSTGTPTINTNGLLNKSLISTAIWDEPIANHTIVDTTGHQLYHQAHNFMVTIDVTSGNTGTTFPVGTEETPVNNLADALLIAHEHKFKTIHVHGDLIIDGEDITKMTFSSDRSLGNSILITSMVNTASCYFQNLTISGALTGKTRFTSCVLGTLTGFDGGAKNSLITSDIHISGTALNYLTGCDVYITDMIPKNIDLNGNSMNLIRCRGNYIILNKTDSATMAIDLVGGQVTIDSSCDAGIIGLSGIFSLIDNSHVDCTVSNIALLNNVTIPNGVLDSIA